MAMFFLGADMCSAQFEPLKIRNSEHLELVIFALFESFKLGNLYILESKCDAFVNARANVTVNTIASVFVNMFLESIATL